MSFNNKTSELKTVIENIERENINFKNQLQKIMDQERNTSLELEKQKIE